MSHVTRALVAALLGFGWFWLVALGPGLFVVFFLAAFPLLWAVLLGLAVLLWLRYGLAVTLTAVGVGAASTWLGIIAFALREPHAFY